MSSSSSPTITPDIVSCAAAPIGECPQCRAQQFGVELALDDVVFRCLGCAARWRVELGYVWRVG